MYVDLSIYGNSFPMRKHKIQVANTFKCELLPCKLHGLFNGLVIEIASGDQPCVEVEELAVGPLAFCELQPIPTSKCMEQTAVGQGVLWHRGAPPGVANWRELLKVPTHEYLGTKVCEAIDGGQKFYVQLTDLVYP